MGKLTAKPPKKKEEVEDLRAPDEFVSFWAKVGEQIKTRLIPIGIGIGAAAVIGGVSYGMNKMSETKREHSSHRLARALKIYAAPLKGGDDDPGIAAAAKVAEAMGQDVMKDDDDIPRYKTTTEKLEAAQKELEGLIAEHGPEGTETQAKLARAGILVDLGKYDEALKTYDAYLADAKGESHLTFLARQGRAVVFEAKGDLDQAIGELKKVETDAPFYQQRAQYQQARLLIKKGQKDEGKKLLKSILEKSPGSSLRDEISNRLATLDQ